MFSFVPLLYFDHLRKYLNAHQLEHIHTLVPLLSIIVHPFACFILLGVLNTGVLGVALAYIITYTSLYGVLLLVVKHKGCIRNSFEPITSDAF
jgi:Na+-driven multidrug efflux pump